MNITNKQFNIICSALDVVVKLPLADDDRDKINKADDVICELIEKKRRDNKRISAYIADKRKINKNYAR